MEILVFHADPGQLGGELGPLALNHRIPADAGVWEVPASSCLESGESYAWTVRAIGPDGETLGWARPRLFRTPGAETAGEWRSLVAAFHDGSPSNRFTRPVPAPAHGLRAGAGTSSLAPGPAGLSVRTGTGQVTGIYGLGSTTAGAAVAAENVGEGADLLLVGGSCSVFVTERGMDVRGPGALMFDIHNSGSGDMVLRVDEEAVLTTATGSPKSHSH